MSPEAESKLSERLEQLADEPPPSAPPLFRCARCGDEGALPGKFEDIVFGCDRCGTFYAYGAELPRVTSQQHPEDRRFVAVRFEHAGKGFDGTLSFEREYLRGVALDMLSVADPVVFRAFQTIAAAILGDRNSNSGPAEDDADASLDAAGSLG